MLVSRNNCLLIRRYVIPLLFLTIEIEAKIPPLHLIWQKVVSLWQACYSATKLICAKCRPRFFEKYALIYCQNYTATITGFEKHIILCAGTIFIIIFSSIFKPKYACEKSETLWCISDKELKDNCLRE